MRKLLNLLSGLFLVLVFLAAITFSYYNTTPVAILFGNWQSIPQPVSVWIVGAFVAGGFLGLLLGSRILSMRRDNASTRRLKKELQDAQQEVRKLRAISLKELD
jgi:putative membrane protein